MAKDAFGDAIAYSLSALISSSRTLKEEQLLSMKAVQEGKDVFVWLPVGLGKSLCYQILPFVFDHQLGMIGSGKSSILMVVSLLVSLIVDQVQRLQNWRVKSSIITSGTGIMAVTEKSYWQLIQVSWVITSYFVCLNLSWRVVREIPLRTC